MDAKGVVISSSPFSVKETIDRLETFLKQHGATIYARIDQQAEVNAVKLNLLPLQFIMFGNPKAGGALMTANPVAALDLPLKIIAWEDEQKKVWIAYNDASYIEERYSLQHNPNSPLNLSGLVASALKP
jgi:uncharacterized protein (DUF302 family)